ncbi:adenylate/guanylate cyclase domain-containing protein [Fuchsiella alkaliacetigena]|uniref:adenylate/guanylate cyclase domain-containing protein n=1 Tax=Fuchsiella alkaliacetigena TaxID=957042 RepID=UPI00200A5DBE|nr:adenylate/guanylate cyclase domain-containing protein [Fuchsiella alkaliacetigena]MCK8824082.1 adenylate/guanylate cyclase domain-containing protein [Fuchsiella alkaliacetigena]
MRKRYAALALIITVIYLLLRIIGFAWIENLELVTLNFRTRMRGELEQPEEVKIVAIDDRSLSALYYDEQNPWPWTRDVYAKLIKQLDQGNASSIGIDVSFDTLNPNDREGDFLFAESLFMNPQVTIGSYLINDEEEFAALAPAYQQQLVDNADHLKFRYQLTNLPEHSIPEFFSPYLVVPPEDLFRNSAWAYGTYEVGMPGEDGMYRSIPLVMQEKYFSEAEQRSLTLLPNLGLLTLAAHFDLEPGDYTLDLGNQKIYLGDKRNIPVDKHGYFTLNYYGSTAFEEISVIDVLNMEEEQLKEIFADKVVLIGHTAQAKGLFDLRPTPFNRNEAGVQIHATLIQNILEENYFQRVPFWVNLLVIFSLVFIAANLLLLSNLKVSIFSALIFIGVFNIVNYWLFLNNIWLDLFYPNLVLILFLLYNVITKVYQENKERIQTKDFFSRYVPAPVVQTILEDPTQINLGGKEMEITVLFSDIIGFTKISEQLTPTELVRLLNEYFTEMTEIIMKEYGGTLDKFIGDAIIAIFGAPFPRNDDPLRAVQAALAMKKKSDELQQKWQERGENITFDIGIGVNTGPAVVGNIGSPERINYTCIGDSVNVGARLESATRKTNSSILISSSTYEQVKGHFICEEIPNLTVKGKSESLTVYKVIDKKESAKLD